MGFANLLSGGFRRGDTLPEGQWRSEMVIQGMFLNIYTDENEYNQALSDYYEPYESVYKSLTPKNRPSQGYLLFEQMSEAVLKERVARIMQLVPKESPFIRCDNNNMEKIFGDLILQAIDGILALRSIVDINYPIMENSSSRIIESFLKAYDEGLWSHPLYTIGGFRGFINMFLGEKGAVPLEEITEYFADRTWCLHSDSIETFFNGLIALRNIIDASNKYYHGDPYMSADIINGNESITFIWDLPDNKEYECVNLLLEKLFHPDPTKSWSRAQMIRFLDHQCGGTTAIREFETDN